MHVAALMGELEANKLQKAALVEELTKKIQVLQQQVSRLEAERSSLQDQQKSLTEQEMQMASLRQVGTFIVLHHHSLPEVTLTPKNMS